MKNSKYGIISIVLMAALMLFGCAQPDMSDIKGLAPAEPVVARINLPNEEVQSRTILPGKLGNADHYTITLNNETLEKPYVFEDQKPHEGKIDIIGVLPGSYTVAVDGFNGTDQKIYMGTSSENLVIKVDKVQEVTVILNPTTGPGLTGSIEATFDWTTLLAEGLQAASEGEFLNPTGPLTAAIAKGELTFQLYAAEIGSPLEKKGEVKWTSEDGNSFKTCRFDNIPTSQNLAVAFSILDKDGKTIVDKKFGITAQVFADQVSYYNGDSTFRLHLPSSMNMWYSNISNLEVAFPTTEIDTSLIFTWDDFKRPDQSSIFKEIELSVFKMSAPSKAVATYKIDPATLEKNEYTVKNLEKGVPYFITTRTVSHGGKSSDTVKWTQEGGKGFVTKVEVESITFSEDIARTLTTGDTFTLTATVNPSNASYTGIKWAPEKEDTLFISESAELASTVTATANKPGVTRITVTNDDPKTPFTATTANDITIKLNQPVNVVAAYSTGAKTYSEGIAITWNSVEFAEKYVVSRSTDSAPYEDIATVTDLTYIDSDIVSGSTYKYKVRATAPAIDSAYAETHPEFKADSADSAASEPVLVPVPQVSIKFVDIKDKPFELTDNGHNIVDEKNNIPVIALQIGEKKVITLDKPIEGMTEYAWYVNTSNKIEELSGTYQDAKSITISNELPYIDYGEDGLQELTLVVSKPLADGKKESYSFTIQFTVITRPVQSVVWKNSLREDLRYSTAYTGELKLQAVTIPGNATMKDVRYEIINVEVPEGDLDKDVAAIHEQEGVITIKKEGKVTFQAYSLENKEIKSEPIVLTFYRPTVVSAENLLLNVNRYLGSHIKKTNDNKEFSYAGEVGDWWSAVQHVYSPAKGVTMKGNTSAPQKSNGGLIYEGFVTPGITSAGNGAIENNIGSMVMNAKDIGIWAYDWGGGNLYRDGLSTIGYTGHDNKMVIDLPYYQGKATITYKGVSIYNKISGTYEIVFEHELLVDSNTVLRNDPKTPYVINATRENIPYETT